MKLKKHDIQKPSDDIKWMKPEDNKTKKQKAKETAGDVYIYGLELLWRRPSFAIPGFESIDELGPKTDLDNEEGERSE